MTTDSSSAWSTLFNKILGHGESKSKSSASSPTQEPPPKAGIGRRFSRRVVPGLPRPGTFKRQQSELRDRLEPVIPDPAERRAVSVDRRRYLLGETSDAKAAAQNTPPPRQSAPDFLNLPISEQVASESKIPDVTSTIDEIEGDGLDGEALRPQISVQEPPPVSSSLSMIDAHSIVDGHDIINEQIAKELETCWILNLSMHFRDHSKREKFFVTYAETPQSWRRVTISVDYRNAPENSLEWDLSRTRYQRDKSARIYEAIRESLPDIQFYPTVTNLKLETENDRLHVHVTEDVHEIIHYPYLAAVEHLNCRRVREDELHFDSHLSGFVYKVKVDGEVFIKKEIPGPNTVDEFLYEINALHTLSVSQSVIQFKGIIVDSSEKVVKGLLIAFAERGALVDVIYDERTIAWNRRERWARQIVQGLSEIHEAGFVQGDFTLSNIVIDDADNAKIIDINRRGCPFKWEPPEMYPLIQNNQRISMYIGVKSDLWQLGICLWALAMENDEPETAPRPLTLDHAPPEIPTYYRELVHICLSENPRDRRDARELLQFFPPHVESHTNQTIPAAFPEDRHTTGIQYVLPTDPVHVGRDWSHYSHEVSPHDRNHEQSFDREPELVHDHGRSTTTYEGARSEASDDYAYPSRGRSPAPRPTLDGDDNYPYIISVSPTGRPGYQGSDTPSNKLHLGHYGSGTPLASHPIPMGSGIIDTESAISRSRSDFPPAIPRSEDILQSNQASFSLQDKVDQLSRIIMTPSYSAEAEPSETYDSGERFLDMPSSTEQQDAGLAVDGQKHEDDFLPSHLPEITSIVDEQAASEVGIIANTGAACLEALQSQEAFGDSASHELPENTNEPTSHESFDQVHHLNFSDDKSTSLEHDLTTATTITQ